MNKQDKKKLFGLIPVSGLKGWDLVCLHFASPFVALIFNESLMFFLLHGHRFALIMAHVQKALCCGTHGTFGPTYLYEGGVPNPLDQTFKETLCVSLYFKSVSSHTKCTHAHAHTLGSCRRGGEGGSCLPTD